MTCWKLCRKSLLALATFILLASSVIQFSCILSAQAQSPGSISAGASSAANESSSSPGSAAIGFEGDGSEWESAFPEAPGPESGGGGNPEHYNAAPPAEWHQPPFSRIGIGADVSPLGIGVKTAIVLNRYFDARLMGNFFSYHTGRVEVEGFNVDADLHMASSAASLDWYPFNSIWRLSPGLMFFNANQISGAVNIVPGTSFTLNNQTFYSANANAATGATPLTGGGALGLHSTRPAATLAGGFGKFIPRSNRHWSFPTEFGVVFTGAPSININTAGWACLDVQQTQCGNLSNPTNPVTVDFNSALQSTLTKWRKDLGKVQVYPIFSYSVVYSFNVR